MQLQTSSIFSYSKAKQLVFKICILSTSLFFLQPVFSNYAEDKFDPEDTFIKALASIRQGDLLSTNGHNQESIPKYQFAIGLLNDITKNNPNWQSLIVSYRKHQTEVIISQLQSQSGKKSVASLVPTSPDEGVNVVHQMNGSPINSTSVTGEPSKNSPLDDPLPEADSVAAPLITTNVDSDVVIKKAEAIDSDESISQKSVKKLKKLEEELKLVRTQLQSTRKEKTELQTQLNSAEANLALTTKKADKTLLERNQIADQLEKQRTRFKETTSKDPNLVASREDLKKQIDTLQEAFSNAVLSFPSSTSTTATTVANDSILPSSEVVLETTPQSSINSQLPPIPLPLAQIDIQSEAVAQTHLAKILDNEDRIPPRDPENSELITNNSSQPTEGKLQAPSEQVIHELKDKNDQLSTQLTEITHELETAKERVAGKLSNTEVEALNANNAKLAQLSIKLLKEQAKRVHASRVLSEQLAHLDIQSKPVSEQMVVLNQPGVMLTDEERKLFKEPLITASENNDDGPLLAASLVAVSHSATQTENITTKNETNSSNTSGPIVQTAPTLPVPSDLLPLAKQAKENLDRGHYAEAESAYTKILSRDPKNVYVLSNLGVVYSRSGKLKSAELTLKKALGLIPNDAFCFSTLGIVCYQMRKYDDAIDYLTKAITRDPKNPTAHNYLGITSSQKGWPEAAIAELEKAVALNPNYADAHFNIAVICAMNQPLDKPKALQHYKAALQLGSNPDPELEKILY